MKDSQKTGFSWNFTTVVTAQGYCYVKAYKMKWDPVLKKSKRHLQRHVGRLLENDRIKISPSFAADFPEYSGDDWFFFMKRTGARHANLPASRRRILKPRFVQTQQQSTNSDLRRTRVSS